LIPPTVIPYWISALTQSRTRVVKMEGVGHAPQFEAPVRMTSVLSRLLKPLPVEKTADLQQTVDTVPDQKAAEDPSFSAEFFPLLR
jgi:hypothetical protein